MQATDRTYNLSQHWAMQVEPNEDRDGQAVYLIHSSGDGCSLACADNEGETCDGLKVPAFVIKSAFNFIEKQGIDY